MSGTGRKTSPIEEEFRWLDHFYKNLDHFVWHHGNHPKQGNLEMLKEQVQVFDEKWVRFKTILDEYERQKFADAL